MLGLALPDAYKRTLARKRAQLAAAAGNAVQASGRRQLLQAAPSAAAPAKSKTAAPAAPPGTVAVVDAGWQPLSPEALADAGLRSNISLAGPSELRVAHMFVGTAGNKSRGAYTYTFTDIAWAPAEALAAAAAGKKGGSGLSAVSLAIAIVVPIAATLLGLAALYLLVRPRLLAYERALADAKAEAAAAAAAAEAEWKAKQQGGRHSSGGSDGSSTILAGSGYPGSSSGDASSRDTRSGPSADIQAACKDMAGGGGAGGDDEIQLDALLGEGS